ncbi:unnamed protein product, partial [Staurois parvus]
LCFASAVPLLSSAFLAAISSAFLAVISSASWQQSHQHSWQQSHQLPGSNLISFTQLQLWLLRDAFTPGCHQILSSHGPLFTMLQNMASLSPSCSLQLCVQNPTSA